MGDNVISIGKSVDPGENVLLLNSEFEADGSPVCMGLLTVESPAEKAVLSVTVTESPEDRIQLWEQHADSQPAAATTVNVDASTRSAAAQSTNEDHSTCEMLSRRTVASPSNLTGLGIEITNALEELTDTDENRQPVVCFHSLTPLLQYVPREELFQFVHKITNEFAKADAIAHFHMDPTVHDEQTIATFLHLFDAIIVHDDGEWKLTTR